MSQVNPYKKTAPVRKPVAKPRYGPAQQAFITATRKLIDVIVDFFQKNDWQRMRHCSHFSLVAPKKLSVDSFYVKDMAVWLPHMILPHYTPSCSKCGLKTAVDPCRYRWVENPKLLHGVKSHRCLDTVYYYCGECNKEFTGLNPSTLTTDAQEITGILNFWTSNGFAIDEELYSHIDIHSSDTTSLTHQRLKAAHADHGSNLQQCTTEPSLQGE